jgi:hypothetical protein
LYQGRSNALERNGSEVREAFRMTPARGSSIQSMTEGRGSYEAVPTIEELSGWLGAMLIKVLARTT